MLPGPINEKPDTTLSVFEEGAIEHILRAKIWLYGFDSVFWQLLIGFLFVVFVLFLAAKKIDYGKVLMPFYRNIGNRRHLGYCLISSGFHYFEANCFKKVKLIF